MKTVRIFKKLLVLVVLIPLVSFESPLSKEGECKDVLYSYFDFLKSMNKNREGKVYYAEYTTWNEFNESSAYPKVKTVTKVFSSLNRIMLDDDYMKIYGDSLDVFVVLPKLKRIYLNNSDPSMFRENTSYEDLINVEEVLLKTTNDIVCSENDGIKEFTILPGKKFKDKTKLKKQNITYSEKENRILKIDNSYTKLHKIKRQVIEYNILEFDSKRKMKSPKSYLYNGNSLKKEFKSFEIIDNRNTPE